MNVDKAMLIAKQLAHVLPAKKDRALEALAAEVERLRAENEALKKTAGVRHYENPPFHIELHDTAREDVWRVVGAEAVRARREQDCSARPWYDVLCFTKAFAVRICNLLNGQAKLEAENAELRENPEPKPEGA